MIPRTIMIWCLLALLASAFNYYTSDQSRRLQARLADAHENIAAEQERARVLQAEWAYLTTPNRLEKIAGQWAIYDEHAAGHVVSLKMLNDTLPRHDAVQRTASLAWQKIDPTFAVADVPLPTTWQQSAVSPRWRVE
ncbi:MAG: hypothetical protein EBQ89_08850 [Alphaproteobacteria bacterium]|nr:hypothetical protein [Alphaproteobacteria bacterium]